MRRALFVLLVLLAACAGPPVDERPTEVSPVGSVPGTPRATPAVAEASSRVRLLFGGDVMLGRGVARLAAEDPGGPLGGIRWPVASADLAVANLESPLTSRPHDPSAGPNALEAPPSSARFLADAGLDAVGVANNHAGDTGPRTVPDTVVALDRAGLEAVGCGTTSEAFSPAIVHVGEVDVALLAFDATGQGPRATERAPGVAWWDRALVREAVAEAREAADVVAVGLHGGQEYLPVADPYLFRLARILARWGVDVVWGHGPHVLQPIRTINPDGDGRPTIVATSLGNLIFDQHLRRTQRGGLLEVLAGPDGVRAYRLGIVEHRDGPATFRGWRAPRGDAVALVDGWWALAGPVAPAPERPAPDLARLEVDVVDAAVGDVDADGRPDVVVAFRRPYRPDEVNLPLPRSSLVDALGRSAHVGVYRPRGLRPRWVAGTLAGPIAAIAPCDGALAVGYSTLNGPGIVATSAWRWAGFGFVALSDLPGPGVPACADVDGDGALDAVIVERSPR